MNNKDWGEALKAAYSDSVSGERPRAIRAPIPGELDLGGDSHCLRIELGYKAVNEYNMQAPSGAFDGWLWVIRHWCNDVVHFEIELKEDVPIPEDGEGFSSHSGRVVFRVRMLKKLLGDELELGDRLRRFMRGHPWHDPASGGAPVWLNVATSGRGSTSAGPLRLKTEADYELALCRHPELSRELATRFGLVEREGSLSGHALCRQFPVGVFDKDPASRGWTALCPKGKSAIDLIGVDGDGVIHIFELKKPGAIAVGALSELMFYACLLHEALDPSRIRFSGADGPKGRKTDPAAQVFAEDVEQASAIHAHLFAPDVHPLLHTKLFKDISELAENKGWKMTIDRPDMGKALPSLARLVGEPMDAGA